MFIKDGCDSMGILIEERKREKFIFRCTPQESEVDISCFASLENPSQKFNRADVQFDYPPDRVRARERSGHPREGIEAARKNYAQATLVRFLSRNP